MNYTRPKDKVIFELDEKQVAKLKAWQEKKGEIYVGAIGGAYEFCFIPTSAGHIVHVKCVDGTELDLTDSEHW